MSGEVYFAQIEGGPIKIGFTSFGASRRIAALQTGCPWPILLIGAKSAKIWHESYVHDKFSDQRMCREWFSRSAKLTLFIENVLSVGFEWPPESNPPVPQFESRPVSVSKKARQEMASVASAYSAALGKSLSAVSAKIYGTSWFLKAFIDGKQPNAPTMTLRKFDQIMEKFRKEWPAGVPWPGTGNEATGSGL